MKYLLLGGSGFIGSHLAKKLALRHHVVVTGRSLNSKITGNVKKNVLDISVIHRETGWRPKISLENGISRIIASQINNGGDDV